MVSYLSKKQANKLIFLCWLMYSSAYLGRLNFSANLIRIVEDLDITKAEAGLIASCFFFAYGIGQLFHGFMNKYYNPRIMIAVSLIGSAVINLIFPFSSSLIVMNVLWALNGFLQAILWTTLTRTLSRFLDSTSMSRSILIMGTTTAVGTVAAYGISALFVEILNWQATFWFASVAMAAIGVLWFFAFHHLTCDIPERHTKMKLHQIKGNKMGRVFILLIVTLCLFGVLNNLIRDGLTTWTPSVFYELYHLDDSLSILLTLGLPMLSVLGSTICIMVHKKIRDHVKLCGIFFAAAFLAILIMVLLMPLNSWLITLLCFAFAALMMASINNCITSVVPLELRDMADSGATAGITNTFCYFGSTLSTYVFGALADSSSGWLSVFYLMLALTAFAGLICCVYIPLHYRLALDKKRKV